MKSREPIILAEAPFDYGPIVRTTIATILIASLFWAQFQVFDSMIADNQVVIAMLIDRQNDHGRELSRHSLLLDRMDDRQSALGSMTSNFILSYERAETERQERARQARLRRQRAAQAGEKEF